MAATAIPLCCYICPQEPEFSDLSHLLTHVSSKGHLSHYLKAQLRGRGEVDVRRKVEAYDHWYEQHQIEQLLSQRLSAKGSRYNAKNERKPTKLTRGARNLKNGSKRLSISKRSQIPFKTEPAIDPQLSQSQASPRRDSGHQFHSSGLDLTGQTQLHVPHMSDWQYWQSPSHLPSHGARHTDGNDNPEQHASNHVLENGSDIAGENDYFKAFVRSPTRTACPESPEERLFLPMSPTLPPQELPERLQDFNARALFQDDVAKDEVQVDLDPTNSPILKGVKWPGMSLFDSACADAQRLRNQKKDQSVLRRMAQNSSVVEQMEYIYWPDGTLKKSRFITGNVESSPESQASPVPKRVRRARTTKPRTVLADLSTNGPTLPKKVGRKPRKGRISPDLGGNENLINPYTQYPVPPSDDNGPSQRAVATQRHSLRDSPSIRPPRRNFQVYRDDKSQSPPVKGTDFHPVYHAHNRDSQSGGASYGASTPLPRDDASFDWYDQLRFYADTPVRSEASERLPRVPSPVGKCRPNKSPVERVTQRYFSVTGNEEPQFFNSMPPQMDFGGMVGPKYCGATLNPLNPYIRQSQLRSPVSWLSSARMPSMENNTRQQDPLATSSRALKK